MIIKTYQFDTLVELQWRPIGFKRLDDFCSVVCQQVCTHSFEKRYQLGKLMQIFRYLIYQTFNFASITLMLRASLTFKIIHQAHIGNSGERNDNGDQYQ